jgi:cobaltochelatase CobN
MNVVLPELDGRLLTRAISFKAEAPVDPRLEFASVAMSPTPIASTTWRALRWRARPRHDAWSDRRLALVLSDYPARGGRTGYAVGLDTRRVRPRS